MSKTFGLTHLAIAVKNIGTSLDFYTRVFEMEVMYYEDKMIQLTTPGNHDVLVFEEKVHAPTGQSGGIAHFGFRLKRPEDLEEIYNKVLESGVEIEDKGEFVPGSPYLFFRDPDGYLIEVWYEVPPA